jgi:prepilin-type N-terminal cleavage/methylation domain-containing protein
MNRFYISNFEFLVARIRKRIFYAFHAPQIVQIRNKISKLRNTPSAFTLAEVLIALGVISVAMAGILSLLPLALETALECKLETRATLIAQAIFADIQSGSGPSRRILTDQNRGGEYNSEILQIDGLDEVEILYDNEGLPLNDSARREKRAVFVARITAYRDPFEAPGLSAITVSIEHPAQAPSQRRRKHVFLSYVEL